MTISRQQTYHAVDVASATRTIAFTLATAPLENDVIYLCAGSTVAATFTKPSDWFSGHPDGANARYSTSAHGVFVIGHVVTAAEASGNTVSWTLTDIYNFVQTFNLMVVVYRGVDPTDLISFIGSTIVDPAAATAEIPLMDGTWMETDGVLFCFHSMDSLFSGQGTTPTGWTRVILSTARRYALYEYNATTTNGVNVGPASLGTTGTDEQILVGISIPPATSSFTGSSFRIFSGSKALARIASGLAASIRLFDGTRLHEGT